MKSSFLFLFAFSLSSINAQYYPLVQEGSAWAYQANFHDSGSNFTSYYYRVEIKTDTMVDELNYNKVYGTVLDETEHIGYIREVDKRVYYLPVKGNTFHTFLTACDNFEKEFILYDFNIGIEDTLQMCDYDFWAVSLDTLDFSGYELPSYEMTFKTPGSGQDFDEVVTGIGSISEGFFGPTFGSFENINYFKCVSNGDIQFCEPNQSNYLPFTDCKRIVAVENIIEDKIVIAPNPIQSVLNFQSKLDYDSYKIFNSAGTQVQEGKLTDRSIIVDQLNSGMYFLKLEKDEKYIIKYFSKN